MNRASLTHSGLAIVGALALAATLASQHPNPAFNRLRAWDRFGVLIPNWRFFAPEPATHDFHFLHRTLDNDEQTSPWQETDIISPRRWHQSVWFPDRRREKAMFDVATELLAVVNAGDDRLSTAPVHRAICAHVRHVIRSTNPHADEVLQGFQFLLAKHPGLAPDGEPVYLYASAFIPLDEQENGDERTS